MNRVRVVSFVWMYSALVLAACGGDDKKLELGGSCSLNSDCADPLLCKLGSCRKACMTSVDCENGGRCVTVDGVAVCQTQAESMCRADATCTPPLVCRTVDNTCRSACTSSGGCMLSSQTCVGLVCVDTSEIASPPDASVGAADAAIVPDAGSVVDAPTFAADAALRNKDTAVSVADRPFSADVALDAGAEASKDSARDLSMDSVSMRDAGGAGDSPSGPVRCVGTPQTITYDGTSLPNSAAYTGVFSTQSNFSSTSWSVANGELQMKTAPGQGIWFGREVPYQPVNWGFATAEMGNTLSIRAKLGADSENWYAYFIDSSGSGPTIWFRQGHVVVVGAGGSYMDKPNRLRYDVDTSVYHTYLLSVGAGRLVYSVDGVEVASKEIPIPQGTYESKLIIGDGNASSIGEFGQETGTFYIQQVTIQTHTACLR